MNKQMNYRQIASLTSEQLIPLRKQTKELLERIRDEQFKIEVQSFLDLIENKLVYNGFDLQKIDEE